MLNTEQQLITETGSAFPELEFEPMNFVENLSYMGLGMLGIFIVIALVMGVTFTLNKVFSGKKKDENDQ